MTSLFWRTTIPTMYIKNIFPSSTIFPIWAASSDQGARESFEDWHTVLISPFFIKVWAVITGLTIADSSSLRLRKLLYWRCDKTSNPPSFIPSTYCRYFHTLLILPQELTFLWKSVPSLDFHHTFSIRIK